MKNLKRALSLVLATVMVIGMMVVGASAAGYADLTDKDEIVNKEAVAVVSELGLIVGYNNEFKPDLTIDRAGMAKLICLALNGGKDPILGTKDVPTYTDIKGHWAESYIEYCSALGYINGDGAGKFYPNAKLTGTAAAKMLLTALGYNAGAQGYVDNANWTVNVMRDANTTREWTGRGTGDVRSLVDGVSASANADLTRDMAAQMIFNALFVANVEPEYQWDMGQQYVAKYTAKPSMADTMYNGLYAVYGTLTNYGDSNETMVDGRTVRAASLAEDVGTTVVYYKNTRGLVSSVAVSANADEILGTSFGGYTLANLSTRRNPGFIALADSAVTFVYQNGIATEDEIVAETTLASSVNALVAQNGVITELIDTDGNGKYDVVRITEKAVAAVDSVKVTTTTDGDKLLSVSGIAALKGVNVEDVTGYEDITSGDVVLYYKDVNGNWFVEAAESFEGTLTAGTAGKSGPANAGDTTNNASSKPAVYTVSKDKYEASGLFGTMAYSDIMGFKSKTATYWLDNGGNIIHVEGETTPREFLMVLANDKYTEPGDAFTAHNHKSQVVFMDDTVKVVDVAKVIGQKVSGVASETTAPQQPVDDTRVNERCGGDSLFTYTVDKNGAYVLTPVRDAHYDDPKDADDNIVTIGANGATSGAYITNGRPAVFDVKNGASDPTAATKAFNTDSKTVYLVRDFANGKYKDSYTVYTGYENVPSMQGIYGAAYCGTDTVAEYVIINAYTFIDTDAGEVVYTMDSDITAVYEGGKVDHYEINVLKDGVKTSLVLANNAVINSKSVTVDATITANKLYTIKTYNADGEVTTLAPAVNTAPNAGTKFWTGLNTTCAIANDILVLGDVAFSYDKDTVVYFVYDNGDVVTGDVYDIDDDATDIAEVVVASATHGSAGNTLATEIYINVEPEAGTTYEMTFVYGMKYVKNGGAVQTVGNNGKVSFAKTDSVVVFSSDATKYEALDLTATGCTVTDNGDGSWTLTNFNKNGTVTVDWANKVELSLKSVNGSVKVTVDGVEKTVTTAGIKVSTNDKASVKIVVIGTSNGKALESVTGVNCDVWSMDTNHTVDGIKTGAEVTFTLPAPAAT